jgi:hypothetical protein
MFEVTATDSTVVGLALTAPELALVVRGVRGLIEQEGWSTTAISVAEMLEAPLSKVEISYLHEAEIE